MDLESLHDVVWLNGWKSDSKVTAGVNRFQIIAEFACEYTSAVIFELGCGDSR